MQDRKTKVFTIQITPQMHEQMRVAAFHERASMGELTRRALDYYMNGMTHPNGKPKKVRRVVKGKK